MKSEFRSSLTALQIFNNEVKSFSLKSVIRSIGKEDSWTYMFSPKAKEDDIRLFKSRYRKHVKNLKVSKCALVNEQICSLENSSKRPLSYMGEGASISGGKSGTLGMFVFKDDDVFILSADHIAPNQVIKHNNVTNDRLGQVEIRQRCADFMIARFNLGLVCSRLNFPQNLFLHNNLIKSYRNPKKEDVLLFNGAASFGASASYCGDGLCNLQYNNSRDLCVPVLFFCSNNDISTCGDSGGIHYVMDGDEKVGIGLHIDGFACEDGKHYAVAIPLSEIVPIISMSGYSIIPNDDTVVWREEGRVIRFRDI